METARLMRAGLAALLSKESDLAVVGAIGDGAEIVPMAIEVKPNVALVDADLPTRDAFGVARELRGELPECAIIFTAVRCKPGDLQRATAVPAAGFLLKDTPAESLTSAIRRVARGERVVDADLVFAALNRDKNPLTPRELDVLRLLAEGASTAQIADALVVTIGTVRNHLSRINSKIGARNRVQAIRIAQQSKWI
ncbi:MAG TPA: response regulator transcription factor [Streptosporangiaceae bacterium]